MILKSIADSRFLKIRNQIENYGRKKRRFLHFKNPDFREGDLFIYLRNYLNISAFEIKPATPEGKTGS